MCEGKFENTNAFPFRHITFISKLAKYLEFWSSVFVKTDGFKDFAKMV